MEKLCSKCYFSYTSYAFSTKPFPQSSLQDLLLMILKFQILVLKRFKFNIVANGQCEIKPLAMAICRMKQNEIWDTGY